MSMRQRVEEQLRPSIKQVAEWFIKGLKPEWHAIVNTKNVETQEDFDALTEEAKMAERRALERGTSKSKKVIKESSSEDESSTWDSFKSDNEEETKKKGKKKHWESTSLGEVKALPEELKEAKSAAMRRKVFGSQCKVEGHLKEECTTPPTCAICVM